MQILKPADIDLICRDIKSICSTKNDEDRIKFLLDILTIFITVLHDNQIKLTHVEIYEGMKLLGIKEFSVFRIRYLLKYYDFKKKKRFPYGSLHNNLIYFFTSIRFLLDKKHKKYFDQKIIRKNIIDYFFATECFRNTKLKQHKITTLKSYDIILGLLINKYKADIFKFKYFDHLNIIPKASLNYIYRTLTTHANIREYKRLKYARELTKYHALTEDELNYVSKHFFPEEYKNIYYEVWLKDRKEFVDKTIK